MPTTSIYIIASSLKDLLSLFETDLFLEDIVLGDTWHPSSGFIDESILKGKQQISDLLHFDYDFKGLIEFGAKVSAMTIELLSHAEKQLEFRIEGSIQQIIQLRNKVIEKNAYQANRYKYSCSLK